MTTPQTVPTFVSAEEAKKLMEGKPATTEVFDVGKAFSDLTLENTKLAQEYKALAEQHRALAEEKASLAEDLEEAKQRNEYLRTERAALGIDLDRCKEANAKLSSLDLAASAYKQESLEEYLTLVQSIGSALSGLAGAGTISVPPRTGPNGLGTKEKAKQWILLKIKAFEGAFRQKQQKLYEDDILKFKVAIEKATKALSFSQDRINALQDIICDYVLKERQEAQE